MQQTQKHLDITTLTHKLDGQMKEYSMLKEALFNSKLDEAAIEQRKQDVKNAWAKAQVIMAELAKLRAEL